MEFLTENGDLARVHYVPIISKRILFSRCGGFTLIEMLIVLAIVALLLTIALPKYFGALEKSKEVTLKDNIKVLRVTIDKFYADKGRYPESLDELASEKYLRSVPLDPITESSDTWILIPSNDPDTPGIEDIKSGASGLTHDGVQYESL